MLIRNVEQELALYEAEESGSYNGLLILIIMNPLSKCTLDQLACAFYLVRFTKVLSKLLFENEREHFLQLIPDWEVGNLDSVLSPYVIQKYDKRFVRGLKELLARTLVKVEGEVVSLAQKKVMLPLNKEVLERIQHKAAFASVLIKRYEINELQSKIYQVVGEEQWENLYISTELQ